MFLDNAAGCFRGFIVMPHLLFGYSAAVYYCRAPYSPSPILPTLHNAAMLTVDRFLFRPLFVNSIYAYMCHSGMDLFCTWATPPHFCLYLKHHHHTYHHALPLSPP